MNTKTCKECVMSVPDGVQGAPWIRCVVVEYQAHRLGMHGPVHAPMGEGRGKVTPGDEECNAFGVRVDEFGDSLPARRDDLLFRRR